MGLVPIIAASAAAAAVGTWVYHVARVAASRRALARALARLDRGGRPL